MSFEEYTFHDEHLEPCQAIMDEYKDQEPIMLHVRRGDPNLTDPVDLSGHTLSVHQCIHLKLSIIMRELLLNLMTINPVFVFSDSVDWVKEQDFFSGDRFLISDLLINMPMVLLHHMPICA